MPGRSRHFRRQQAQSATGARPVGRELPRSRFDDAAGGDPAVFIGDFRAARVPCARAYPRSSGLRAISTNSALATDNDPGSAIVRLPRNRADHGPSEFVVPRRFVWTHHATTSASTIPDRTCTPPAAARMSARRRVSLFLRGIYLRPPLLQLARRSGRCGAPRGLPDVGDVSLTGPRSGNFSRGREAQKVSLAPCLTVTSPRR